MTYKYYVFLVSVISINHWINQLSALIADGIRGGEKVKAGIFTYQVAVEGRQNHSNEYVPICGGGILDKNLVICAAHCVVEDDGDLIAYTISVTVGTIDLKNPTNRHIDVDRIYMLRYDHKKALNDIAILKIGFNVIIGLKWTKLRLPDSDEIFADQIAILAGYGYTWIKIGYKNQTQEAVIMDGGSDFSLRYGKFRILSNRNCLTNCWELNIKKHLCAFIIPKNPKKPSGTCRMDSGSPLVINGDLIIGILIKGPFDCDETNEEKRASIYSKIWGYIHFIMGVIKGRLIRSTLVYRNPSHVKKILMV